MAYSLAQRLRQKPHISVDITAIDLNDLTFAVSTPKSKTTLANSISYAGLLHPLWLRPRGAQYQIISGFARTRVCVLLGWETVPALVAYDEISNFELAQLAVLDNNTARILNPVEEALATALLQKFAPNNGEFCKAMQNLGLSQNPKHMQKLQKLLQLPKAVQNAVANDAVSLAVAYDLAAFEPETAKMFTDIFVQGKVGLNRQREFIRLVFELGRLKDLAPLEVFKLPQFEALWHNSESDQRKKAILLLEWLYRERYPHIHAARESARQKIAALGLDNRIRLNMPENFENLRHGINFAFENKAELLEILDLCLKMAQNPAFGELFKREDL